MTAPLISCVMPTWNRHRFLPTALRCFARQTWPRRELILVSDDDTPPPIPDGLSSAVRLIHLPRNTSTGAKLNIGIQAARGSIIQKLDDDDWYAPTFLETHAGHLLAIPAEARDATLIARCCYLILLAGDHDLTPRFSGHGWNTGSSLAFWKSLWMRHRFPDRHVGEDSAFIRDSGARPIRVCDNKAAEHIVVRHHDNSWTRMTTGHADDYYRACPPHPQTLDELIPPDDFSAISSI